MPYVVTSNCQDCKFTDCVEVCPVDCFYGDGRMLYIHPEDCIDCGACEPACPVEAIFPEEDVPDAQTEWIKVNAERATSGDLENVTEQTKPLPTAAAKKASLGL